MYDGMLANGHIPIGEEALPNMRNATESATGGPGQDPDDDNTLNVYKSVKDDPNYPSNFVEIRGGTSSQPVTNRQLLSKLRQYEKGTWRKIYKDGTINGKKASLHYFRSQSGRTFGLKPKNYWSNL